MRIHSTALIRSTIAVIWLIVGMTLLTEVSPEFKSFLTQFSSHHWIGKSILSAAALVVSYLFFKKFKESNSVLGGVFLVIGSAILGGVSIFSFFLWHFLNK
ncbi:MAG: hypothetical protein A2756_04485 [Candidatus Ryanbacteria bacterium RIFCSPHIGHO2_01_FULL_48_27]|uniref:Uncharacterized protein n=1 Tax=Candidatus Ryanbacteria bacterium RIFCSPHIGHO2_01_FULL_48_27 TaxID=1802115 RepID=A0A1G2G763_9BACT|nr:MAG: hypothetical protein A2756_04485 [Candidatus Ryanbacteria bacterium RIFCSPHIGHO2_01_FULL_48_27]